MVNAAAIFTRGAISDVVESVLDLPVASFEGQ